MNLILKILKQIFLFFSIFIYSFSFADNHNIYETLEQIQKDIKTLKKQFILTHLI